MTETLSADVPAGDASPAAGLGEYLGLQEEILAAVLDGLARVASATAGGGADPARPLLPDLEQVTRLWDEGRAARGRFCRRVAPALGVPPDRVTVSAALGLVPEADRPALREQAARVRAAAEEARRRWEASAVRICHYLDFFHGFVNELTGTADPGVYARGGHRNVQHAPILQARG